ncbi:hypothetical protein [Nocardioides sp. GY 10127]|uniref:hypothetical protein n=1 Tax=Nocardioides sp. GY 10127 TaxID=2569762 RepID=UPI0010A83073|nr:hypothetical protein [Nocardioides sp. GY 10127]TIC86451.1 hypothetical protein E8D37_00635 [Nocardioides sp. GY 10127]
MPRSPLCQCGHTSAVHAHYRAGTDCSQCDCTELRRARRGAGVLSRLFGDASYTYLGADATVWAIMNAPETEAPAAVTVPRLSRKDLRLVRGLEQELRALAADLVDPLPGECERCYVSRTVDELGCDGTLRWTGRYRDLHAPGHAGAPVRAGDAEACDCRVIGADRPADELGCRGVHRGHLSGSCSLWGTHHH